MEAEPDGVRHRLESGWHRKVWASCAPASARSGRLSGAASGPASKAVGARKGVAIDTSAFRHYALTADGPAAQASAARRLHQFGCVGNWETQPAVTRRLCAVQVRFHATPTMRT
jgi:hypothetical protein